jgi:23S rRNA (uracil1939-C5)-methyltransferase
VVALNDCPLHHPLINRIIAVVREEIERQGIWVYDARKKRGLLRYMLVRVSPANNEALVTFVTAERNFREVTHLAKWLTKKVPEVVSVQQNVNSSEGNVLIGRDTLKMLGHPTLRDRVGQTRLAISPASFFQVNHEQAERIYALVHEWADLNPANLALDLYCGIGGIALKLARTAARVIGIEVVEDAVRNARDNARLNKLDNCRFIAGHAAELLEDLKGEFPPGQVITVNPPRKGVDKEVLDAVAEFKPRSIIYVSCNPETLARDLAHLDTLGYATSKVQPVDMFPQTPHVESVALIEPRGKGS